MHLQPQDGVEQRCGRIVYRLWLKVKGQEFKRLGARSVVDGKLAMLTFTVRKPKVQKNTCSVFFFFFFRPQTCEECK